MRNKADSITRNGRHRNSASHTKHQLCRNCGHQVDDNYCPACGQRTTTARLTWAVLVDGLTSPFIGDEAYGLRGINMRKGAVMTWLTILVSPCVSISEYLEGHRRKYFNPVAILLLLSTFYAIVFGWVGNEFTPMAKEGQHLFAWMIYTYYDYATLHPAANLLLKVPFLALAMKTLFRKKADLRYVEYIYIGIFLAVFEITLMILALPAEAMLTWYNPFYMQMLPVFIYMAYVFRKLFGLKKKGAVLRTLLTDILQYIYIIVATLCLLTLSLIGYALIAPEKFAEDFNLRGKDRQHEQVIEDRGTLYNVINGLIDGFEDAESTPQTTVAPDEASVTTDSTSVTTPPAR